MQFNRARMVVTNIHLRIIFGAHSILLGLILLKIYHDRDKDNLSGNLFRLGKEMFGKSRVGPHTDWVYWILGWLSIIGGVIAMFFGFRLQMVGT